MEMKTHKNKVGKSQYIANQNYTINTLKKDLWEMRQKFKKSREESFRKSKYIMELHNFIGTQKLKEFQQKTNINQSERKDKINVGGQNG